MTTSSTQRREFLKAAGGSALALAGAQAMSSPARGEAPERSRRPNIVVMLADDLGYGDCACYGNEHIKTPHLDRMAVEGLRFTDFYVTSPLCTPTRAGLLTGRQPERVGLNYLVSAGRTFNDGLNLKETTLADVLKGAGYATGIIGKWHLGYLEKFWPNKRGFDDFWGTLAGNSDFFTHRYKTGEKYMYRNDRAINPIGYMTDLITEEALRFIERHRAEPFFLYVPYTAVHSPYQATDEYLSRYPNFEGRQQAFYAMTSAMDDSVGAILGKLEELGLDEDTLTFFFSDNGGVLGVSDNGPLRGGKGSIWEGGLREPGIARWPGRIPSGRTTAELASSLDLFPTVCAMAGVRPPDVVLDGANILPLLEGKSGSPHEALHWCWRDEYVMRQGKWKLTQYKDGHFALYDLEADIGETTDLAQTNRDTVEKLRPALQHFRDTIHEGRPE